MCCLPGEDDRRGTGSFAPFEGFACSIPRFLLILQCVLIRCLEQVIYHLKEIRKDMCNSKFNFVEVKLTNRREVKVFYI